MERALMTLFGREGRAETYRRLAQEADVQLGPRGTWLLYRIADHAPITEAELARLLGIDVSDLEQRLTEPVTVGADYISVAVPGRPADGDGARASASVTLTSAGEQAADRLVAAREAGIDRLVTDWKPDKVPELRRLLGRITTTLVATDASPERDGVTAPAAPPR
jgi:DNA-binding MarR family transcriptional regulator